MLDKNYSKTHQQKQKPQERILIALIIQQELISIKPTHKKNNKSYFLLVSNMKESGLIELNMVMEFKFGQMGLSMKVSGLKAKQQEKVDLCIQMEIFMKASGRMINLMDLVFITIVMVQGIKVIGKMICNMVKESKYGQKAVHMRVHIIKEKNMVKGYIDGQMDQSMMDNGLII